MGWSGTAAADAGGGRRAGAPRHLRPVPPPDTGRAPLARRVGPAAVAVSLAVLAVVVVGEGGRSQQDPLEAAPAEAQVPVTPVGAVPPPGPSPARAVTIRPGQTLWDVVREHAPDGSDPRAYLHELRGLNGFDGGSVRPWTVVLLPDDDG
jgi:hypothetical protein